MVWFVLIVNALLAFKLIWDYQATEKEGRVINHARSAIVDGFIYFVSAYFLMDNFLAWVIIAVGYRWVMFDLLFNLIRGKAWDYYGTIAFTDKLLKKLGKFHLLPKVTLIVIGVYLLWT